MTKRRRHQGTCCSIDLSPSANNSFPIAAGALAVSGGDLARRLGDLGHPHRIVDRCPPVDQLIAAEAHPEGQPVADDLAHRGHDDAEADEVDEDGEVDDG